MSDEEPSEHEEPVVPAENEAQDAVDDDSDVEAHGSWGSGFAPEA